MNIEVVTGGCAGFQYKFSLVDELEDYIFIDESLKIITDESSLSFLKDCIIDYTGNEIYKSIQISNSKAVNTCGCGSSFS